MTILKREHGLLRIERSLILTIKEESADDVTEEIAKDLEGTMSSFLFKLGDIMEIIAKEKHGVGLWVSTGIYDAEDRT